MIKAGALTSSESGATAVGESPPAAQEPLNGLVATQLAPSQATDNQFPDGAIGQTIGSYKLREQLGEGGCGVVYVAEQTEPVQRRVALKLIKPGTDGKQASKSPIA
jgi:serine/threonine protein kinase